MTGSLHVKNDKYYMVVNVYENGQRKQKWIGTGLHVKGNKRQAERMLAKVLTDMSEQEENKRKPSNKPFADVVRDWLSAVRLSVDVVTYQGYKDIANNHVIPYFDALGTTVGNLKHSMIQTYINTKADNGRRDGRGGLSASSLRLHKNVINQSCKYAVSEELIASNPCAGVTLPQRTHIGYNYYTAAQVAELLDKIRDDVLFSLIKMTAVYGLRRSEVLGLQWDAINFEEGIITIKRTVTKVYERIEKDKTKNRASYRSYPMTQDVRSMLTMLLAEEEQHRKDFGNQYLENQYVFKWPNGTPFDPDYVTHHFSDLLNKHGLPHIRFHELRHSCASIMIVSGFTLKDVQEWLGHSTIDVTADIYSHLDMDRKVKVGEKMTSVMC